jgi:hypothetical protein
MQIEPWALNHKVSQCSIADLGLGPHVHGI